MNRKLLTLMLFVTGCYAEWDYPAVPRTDPCTGITTKKIVYVQPVCPKPPIQLHRKIVILN